MGWDSYLWILAFYCSTIYARVACASLGHTKREEVLEPCCSSLCRNVCHIRHFELRCSIGSSDSLCCPEPSSYTNTSLSFMDRWCIGIHSIGLATLFAVPVFAKQGRQKWLRRFFLANGLITPLIAFVYFYPDFFTSLLLLGLSWIVTATGSLSLLTLFFRRRSELWSKVLQI